MISKTSSNLGANALTLTRVWLHGHFEYSKKNMSHFCVGVYQHFKTYSTLKGLCVGYE